MDRLVSVKYYDFREFLGESPKVLTIERHSIDCCQHISSVYYRSPLPLTLPFYSYIRICFG